MWQPNYTTPALWQPPSPGGSSPRTPTSDSGTPTKQRVIGRRFGQVIRLKKECLEEYKALHAKAWPEVLKQIKDCNIEDYCIWYDDATSMLFSSFKYYGWDYTGDMERMAENPKVREWWKITDAMQESMVDGAVSSEEGAPGWWKPVEEVFYTA